MKLPRFSGLARLARGGLSLPAATGCFIAFVCLLLFSLCAWQIWNEHEQQMEESTQNGADLARSLTQHADSSLKSVDTALCGLVWDLEGRTWTPAYLKAMNGHLHQQVAGLPQLLGVFVIGQDGLDLADSMAPGMRRPNLVDRDYFTYHRDHADRATHVGPLIKGALSGKWLLPLSRRLNHPDGSFAGVVVAAVDLTYFQNFYNNYALGENGAIVLLHRDGTVIVRRPALPAVINTSIAQSGLFSTYLPRAPAGSYTAATAIDHLEKLIAYRQLDHYPLVVVVARPLDDILADWRYGAWVSAGIVSALVLAVAALGVLLLCALQRTLLAEGALLDSERRVRTITDNLPLALAYAGPDEVLQFANHAFAHSMQREPDQTIGRSYATLLGDDYAERAPFIKTALAGKAVQFERSLIQDGRMCHIESRFIPEIDEAGLVRGFYGVFVDISARKQLELEQQNAHRELQTIIDNMQSMVGYWDADLRYRFANKAMLMRYGAQGDLRGTHAADVVGKDILVANLAQIKEALAGRAQLFERQTVLPDGEVRTEMASYVPDIRHGTVAGFYAYVTDITPLKEARNAQFQARAQLQGVIDAASELSIIATDLAGLIGIFSAGAERMLGYRAEEMVGRRTPSVLHLPDELARHGLLGSSLPGAEMLDVGALIAATRGGRTLAGEWTYVRKDGSRLAVHLVMTAVQNEQGELTGLLGVARDITEQKELLASLNAAKDQAERASRAKSEFVANMSHEIRTPMNAVLGMAQLLGNSALSPVQRNYLDMIQTAGKSLLDILNDILDFSKIEAGRMELSPTAFRLSDVLATLAALLVVDGGKKKLEIVIGVEPDVPDLLVGDPLRLQQILLNVAGNAIKFTEYGEVSVTVARLPARHDGAREVALRFRINDTGIGMSATQQRRLFSAFSQAEESTARRFGGTGLGLAISRRLVDLMNGQIAVVSELGKGSQFQIDLPLALAPEAAAAPPAPRPQHAGQRVLLLEQNRTSARYLASMIRSWQWPVDHAASAAPALALLRDSLALEHGYDIVLADWPPASDAEAALQATLRDVCAEQRIAYIPMVNPYFRQDLGNSAMAAQASAILLKPVTAVNLVNTFNEIGGADGPVRLAGIAGAGLAAPAGAPAAPRLDGVRLLLVEDNRFNQLVAKGMLEHAGATVVAVDNGKEALDHLAQHRGTYQMILMDVQMPVMDGFMATRAIRRDLRLDVPILAMSAGVMLDERDACVAAGMNDFIPKPIDQPQMIAQICRFLHDLPPAPSTVDEVEQETNATMQGAFDRLYNYLPHDPAYQRGILEFLHAMIGQGPKSLQLARASCDAGRFGDAARMLHTMRGSIGSAGGLRFAQTSLALERAIMSPQRAQVARLFVQAEQQLIMLAAAARTWLEARGASVPAWTEVPAGALDALALGRLRAMLEQQNMGACELYAQLRLSLRDHFDANDLAQMDEAMNQLAFAEVLAQLERIAL